MVGSLFHWLAEHLNGLVVIALTGSTAALVFAVLALRKTLAEVHKQLEREKARLLALSNEIGRTLPGFTEENLADTVRVRQKVSEQSESQSEMLSSRGQKSSATPTIAGTSKQSGQGVS